jgi:hypothetical protein
MYCEESLIHEGTDSILICSTSLHLQCKMSVADSFGV